jgi:hypothetical protein
MRKIADPSKGCFNCTVGDSLSTIKNTYVQLHLLTGTSATAARLASQIELYDVLLDEITGIHASLARDLEHTRLSPQVSGPPRLNA